MKTYLDCIPCFLKQTIEACTTIGLSSENTKAILDKVALHIPHINMTSSPPEIGMIIHRIIREQTNNPDPYKELKRQSNEIALKMYPHLKQIVQNSENRLLKAVEIGIAGNIIDYGALSNLDINKEMNLLAGAGKEKIQNVDSKYFAYKDFIQSLKKANTLLYLADNAGEIIFDRMLIEEIAGFYPALKIYFAVRGNPVINDCTLDDAAISGIEKYALIISNGSDAPGTILNSCSKEFLEIWDQSDVIISKGQGNFESLSHVARDRIFFMFIVKCQVLARDIGCAVRDVILCKNTM